MSRFIAVFCALIVGAGLASQAAPPEQARYLNGVFVSPGRGSPIELITYADTNAVGDFKMAYGSIEDVPTLHEVDGVLVNMPFFELRYVFVASHELFHDRYSERRQLPIATSPINIYARHVRIADLQRRERIENLLATVKAVGKTPGYAFIAVESYGYIRYYPVRLSADPTS
jgi:hypothetical protein